LGRHEPPNGEAGPQVGRADVELAVGQEDLGHLVRVHPERAADGADLVGEADLQGVEGVVGVLGHLGDRDRDPEHVARQALVERRDRVGRGRVGRADHGLGRVEEVADAAALAEELRVHRDAEVDPDGLAGRLLQDRDQQVGAGAGEHRAAEHDVCQVGLS
jgi:hypothetical protein